MTPALQDEIRAADGTRLLRRRWLPPSGAPPRVRLLLVHGLGEHLGRYEETGAALAMRGIACVGVDLRGCGRSAGARGSLRRWLDYHADLDAAAPAPPCAVLAHSMGGLVALDWLRARAAGAGAGPPPTALILSGPLLDPAVPVPLWKRVAANALARLWPHLRLPTGIPLADLCTDPAAVAAFERDPLRDSCSTPRWYVEMRRARERVLAALPTLRVPVQFHLAGEERIVSGAAIERACAAWGGPCALVRWPRGRHEILQEPFRAAVWESMADFILARTPC